MKHVGIICEYNPIHTGHAHLLREVRNAETVICVMSGNFTQRGEAAILPPVVRAAMAVEAGADLVLELPFPFSASSARYFATAGVRALGGVGADHIAFGSESGDLAMLRDLAERVPEHGALAASPEKGSASAYFTALGAALSSNDILAVEYLAAIAREKLALVPLAVRRTGAAYRDTVAENGAFPSASALRARLEAGEDVRGDMPPAAARVFEEALSRYPIARTEKLGDAMLALLRRGATDHLTGRENGSFLDVADCGGGLLRRLQKAALVSGDYESLCRAAATKRYTDGRIRRALLYLLSGVTEADLAAPPAYLRLLAMNSRGRKFLAMTEKTRTVPVVTKQSEIAANISATRARALALVADGLYSICLDGSLLPHELQTAKPYFSCL